MNKYLTLKNDYFELLVPEELHEYGKEILLFSTDKIKGFLTFFKEEKCDLIRGAFLLNRDDFISRIKEVAGEDTNLPPEWATGCFYGGETQILVDVNEPYIRFNTLIHESFHLLFSKYVYEKYDIERIVWLDEALAGNFDGTTEKLISNGKFQSMIESLIKNNKLPKMSDLDFSKNNVITGSYNGYDLFKIVGRFLIETKSSDELFNYIIDEEKVLSDGETILNDSLLYFSKKYNLK